MNVEHFKTFRADQLDVDQLIEIESFGMQLRAGFERHGLDEPAYVDLQLKAVKRDIRSRSRETLEAKRLELMARRDSLKTPTERRSELELELEKLNKQLGEPQPA
jgi:hypothetical protein